MGRVPLAGDMFLFVGKNRRQARVLFWDGNGLVVIGKRLEGKVQCPLGRGPGKALVPNPRMNFHCSLTEAFWLGTRKSPPKGLPRLIRACSRSGSSRIRCAGSDEDYGPSWQPTTAGTSSFAGYSPSCQSNSPGKGPMR